MQHSALSLPAARRQLQGRPALQQRLARGCCTTNAAAAGARRGLAVVSSSSRRSLSVTRVGGPAPAANNDDSILDALFMGKALAEAPHPPPTTSARDESGLAIDFFYLYLQALNERLGAAVGEAMSQVGKAPSMSLDDISVESVLAQARTLPRTQQLCLTCAKAEWRQVTKRNAEFGKDLEGLQADVLARARTERLKTLGGSASTGDQNGSAAFQAAAKSAGLKDLSEAVDDLRSEVARARFELRSTLQNKTSNP